MGLDRMAAKVSSWSRASAGFEDKSTIGMVSPMARMRWASVTPSISGMVWSVRMASKSRSRDSKSSASAPDRHSETWTPQGESCLSMIVRLMKTSSTASTRRA